MLRTEVRFGNQTGAAGTEGVSRAQPRMRTVYVVATCNTRLGLRSHLACVFSTPGSSPRTHRGDIGLGSGSAGGRVFTGGRRPLSVGPGGGCLGDVPLRADRDLAAPALQAGDPRGLHSRPLVEPVVVVADDREPGSRSRHCVSDISSGPSATRRATRFRIRRRYCGATSKRCGGSSTPTARTGRLTGWSSSGTAWADC